jgi:hypothetical protein
MALDNIAEIETTLGIESGRLIEMINSEEAFSVDLSEKVFLSKTAYEERIANIKKESATVAIETAVKEQRNNLGLDFQGKTIENLVSAIKAKSESESKIEPEEKYKTLKSEFDGLVSKLNEKDTEFNSFKTQIEKTNLLSEIKNEFTKHIPDNVLVSKSTIFTEAKEKGFSFEKEDGNVVVKDSNGNILKDDNYSPITVKDWVTTFSTPYLAKVEGGAGKGDDTGEGKAGSFEAFMKESERNNWDASKQNSEMAKRISNGTLKI